MHTQGHELSPQGSFQLNQPCFCLPAAAAGAAVSLGKCPAGQEAELPGTSSVGVGAARPCPIVFVIHKHAVHLCGQSFLTGGTGAGFPCGMGAEELWKNCLPLRAQPRHHEQFVLFLLCTFLAVEREIINVFLKRSLFRRMGSGNCFCPSSGNKFDCCCEEVALQKQNAAEKHQI